MTATDDAQIVREALALPFYRAASFFSLEELPQFVALDRLVARVEQAERERDEAQRLYGMEANERRSSEAKASNLAPYVKRAQAAEADYAGAVEALRGLVVAVEHFVGFEPEWNVGGEWSEESTAAWKRIEETLDANLAAARAVLTAADRPEGTTP